MRQEIEPTVADDVAAIPVAARLADLRGKRLGFVDNSKCNADLFIRRLISRFSDQYAIAVGPVRAQGRRPKIA